MDEKSRIEQLERRIADLEGQIEALKEGQKKDTVPRQKMKLEELEVEQIRIVEKDGTIRMSLHNKERMPGPASRVGGSNAGILFFAEDSSEVGGLSIAKTVSLMLDQYHSDQVIALVNAEVDDLGNEVREEGDDAKPYIRGLHVWDLPPGSLSKFRKQFESVHGRPPMAQEVWRPRVFVGRWANGEAKVSLSDSKGRERLRFIVDSRDTPRIELLDENGEVVHYIAPEDFKPLKIPSTDSIPKDRAGRTPIFLLALYDNNFDAALHLLEKARKEFGEEVYAKWHEWLLSAKRMNTTEDTASAV